MRILQVRVNLLRPSVALSAGWGARRVSCAPQTRACYHPDNSVIRDIAAHPREYFCESPPAEAELTQRLLVYPPLETQQLQQDVSEDVLDAMRRTLSGMLGLLPSANWTVTLQTDHATLARLATASMRTGYTLSNVEMRLNLDRQLRSVASLPATVPAPPSQPLTALPALSPAARAQLPAEVAAHIAILEERLVEQQRLLRRSTPVGLQAASAALTVPGRGGGQAAAAAAEDLSAAACMSADGDNELLSWMRGLDGALVESLSRADPTVQQAFDCVIGRLIGSLVHLGTPSFTCPENIGECQPEACSSAPGEAAVQLTASREFFARTLYWCMLLGHRARSLESRLQMQRAFQGP